MDTKKIEQVENALVAFIERVANGKTTSEAEVEILPLVVNALEKIAKF
ncbi:MAG: hypothetical protein ACLSWV_03300 [Pygmaiobacter massiliensis]